MGNILLRCSGIARIYMRSRRCSFDKRSHSMMDVILVAGGTAMFFVGIAYAYACEKL
jgi:hypothetical protein